jgi:Flp pilus assembly protein TadB
MSQRYKKKSFFEVGKTTRLNLFLMEAFIAIAAFVAVLLGGPVVVPFILLQGLLFYGWWWARRRIDARGGRQAQIDKYFEALKK